MKLDWKKTILIGFGFFGISVIWQLYNTFVPIFLQAGGIGFQSDRITSGFGLNASTTGIIMGIDNIAAIFILPLIGYWSDRIRTPIGRRYPFILSAAPVAAIAFILIPVAGGMIDPASNGSVTANTGPFILFMIGALLMLLAMAVLRTPVVSLMPDLTPSPLRSKANGIINLMGGIGFVLAGFVLARTIQIGLSMPFIIGSAVLLGAVLLLFFTTKEPTFEELEEASEHEASEEEQALSALKGLSVVPAEYRRSLIFLLVAIFAWFVAYDGVSTFFSSYSVNVLGISEDDGAALFTIAGAAFLLMAVPAGFIGERIGRRLTITIGLALFASLLVIGFFIGNPTIIGIILGLGGIGWALVNINSLPMVVDTIDDPRLLGTYTGLYYLASQTGSAFAPLLTGSIVDLFGKNFRMIFLTGPAFFLVSIICMQFVKRGEAHTTPLDE